MKNIFEFDLKDGVSKPLDKIIGKVKDITKQLNTFEKTLGKTISKTTEKIIEQQKELEKLIALTGKSSPSPKGNSKKKDDKNGSVLNGLDGMMVAVNKKATEFVNGVIDRISTLKEKIKSIFESVRNYSSQVVEKIQDKLRQGIEKGIDKLKGLKDKTEEVVESVKKISSEISGKIKGVADKAIGFAKDIYSKVKSKPSKGKDDGDKTADVAEKTTTAKDAFLALGGIGSKVLMGIIGSSNELTEKFDGINQKLNGALSGAFQKIQGEALKAFGPFIEDALKLAEQILPYVIDVIDWVVEKISVFFKFLQDHQGIAYILAGAITGIAVAMQLMAFWTAIQTEGTISATLAQLGLNLAFLMSPLGIVIALVGGLVGAFLYLSSKVGGVGNAFKLIWNIIKQVFSNIGDLFGRIFQPIMDTIKYIKAGEWAKAAGSAAQALYNLSPIGMVQIAAEWVSDGGATKGIKELQDKALAEGQAQDKKDEEEKSKNGVPPEPKQEVGKSDIGKPSTTTPTSSGGGRGGGGSGTNITIRIENLVKELIIQSVDGGIPVTDITKQISHALMAAVNDSQFTTG